MELLQTSDAAQPGVTPFSTEGPATQGTDIQVVHDEAARESIEEARQAGRQEGLTQGRRDGAAEAGRKHAAELAALRSQVDALLGYRTAIRGEVEKEVVELAFAVSRRILRREITLDPMAAAGIVRSCLDERSNAEVSRVRVHPSDEASVRECVGPGVDVVADHEIGRGGAVLETTRGALDARIDSQIDELERGLADA